MIKTFKPVLLLLLSGISFLQLRAQDSDSDKDKTSGDQSITIRKKGPTKEKVTVVIDGDNITVNGKPVDDFKSDDIDIIKGEPEMDAMGWNDGGMTWAAPGTPSIHAFRDDMMKLKSNS